MLNRHRSGIVSERKTVEVWAVQAVVFIAGYCAENSPQFSGTFHLVVARGHSSALLVPRIQVVAATRRLNQQPGRKA